MNLLTIVVVLFLAAVMVRGFLRGFVKTLFSMFFLIFALFLAFFIMSPMKTAVEKSENISAFVAEKSNDLVENAIPLGDDSDSLGDLRIAIVSSALTINGVREIAVDKVSDLMMGAIAFLISFVLAAVAIIVVEIILGKLTKKKRISGVNRFFGMLLGLFRGLFIVWTALAVITTLQFAGQGAVLYEKIEASPFLYFLNSHNLVLTVLPKILLSTLS